MSREVGVTCSVGIASTKFVAKLDTLIHGLDAAARGLLAADADLDQAGMAGAPVRARDLVRVAVLIAKGPERHHAPISPRSPPNLPRTVLTIMCLAETSRLV